MKSREEAVYTKRWEFAVFLLAELFIERLKMFALLPFHPKTAVSWLLA